MIMTKVISHHDRTPTYINLDQIVSIYIHENEDYHVEMTDGSSMHIELTDPVITKLLADADIAYST